MRYRYFKAFAGAVAGACFLMTGTARAQTKPAEDWNPPDGKSLSGTIATTQRIVAANDSSATQPSIAGATVTEWVVFIADPYTSQLNGKGVASDTLPSFIEELRDATPVSSKESSLSIPMPIGVIRVTPPEGGATDDSIDISLNYKNGRTLGTWPRARIRSSGILWSGLKWQSTTSRAAPMPIPDDSWIVPLRSGSPSLLSGATAEPFLLYDLELAYPVALQLKDSGNDAYTVVQPMDAPLHNLTFYKHDADGRWKTATITALTKTPGSSLPDVKKKPTVENQILIQAGTRPARVETPPSTAPTTQPQGTEFTLVPAIGSDVAVLNSWHGTLTNEGVSDADQQVVLKILAKYALDSKRLTAVYRMDPAELDRILPLEVLPQPRKISRIALVVVTGIDPSIGLELDGWIAKLGSKSWAERQRAMDEIKKMGPMARARLEKATNDKDIEIVYRAEQLLENMKE